MILMFCLPLFLSRFFLDKINKIIYVGNTDVAKNCIGKDTKFVELGGKLMMPGFAESHMHITVGATLAQGLWLAHLNKKEDYLL